MKKIHIIDLLQLLNKYLPNSYYSILDLDALMPKACMPDGEPAFDYIDKNIKEYITGCTFSYNELLAIAKSFDDVKDLYIVINKTKNEVYGHDENETTKYINASYFKLIVEDLDLVEISCKDPQIEKDIMNALGEFPIWIITDNHL